MAGAPNRPQLHRKPHESARVGRNNDPAGALSLEGTPHGSRGGNGDPGSAKVRHISRQERLLAGPGDSDPTRQFRVQVEGSALSAFCNRAVAGCSCTRTGEGCVTTS